MAVAKAALTLGLFTTQSYVLVSAKLENRVDEGVRLDLKKHVESVHKDNRADLEGMRGF